MEPIAFPSAVAADLHCHTLASTHAYSTVTELAGAAARAGLAALAVTDHGIGLEDSPHLWHFECLKILPPEISGVRILHGVEANVMDMEGRIDMPESLLAGLDIVVASMHGGLTPAEGREACTEAWLRVAANPHVDIIGHSGTPCYAYDYERVIPVFGSYGKVVEINENTFAVRESSLENCRRIALLCKKHRVRVVLDSDAHYHEAVGRVPRCLALLRDIGFPPELIVNGSRDGFAAFCREKGISI